MLNQKRHELFRAHGLFDIIWTRCDTDQWRAAFLPAHDARWRRPGQQLEPRVLEPGTEEALGGEKGAVHVRRGLLRGRVADKHADGRDRDAGRRGQLPALVRDDDHVAIPPNADAREGGAKVDADGRSGAPPTHDFLPRFPETHREAHGC
mmetsp:Transcript_9815/g.28111  ORF Transcript_9815/g.28111 Transcript_9815/m.28111 type:complete len:150 (+) Transcript_9815:615-1064(+)